MGDPVRRLAIVIVVCSTSSAEEIDLCDPALDPDTCADVGLNIRFVDGDSLTSDLAGIVEGQEISARITMDVMTAGITGLAYGVRHDPAILEIPQPAAGDPTCAEEDVSGCNPTIIGTTPLVEDTLTVGFMVASIAEGSEGFISAIVFNLKKFQDLPIGMTDYPLCNVKYRCIADPGMAGSRLTFTEELNLPGTPKTKLVLSHNNRSKLPRRVTHAVVSGKQPFRRGDVNGDGVIDITDGLCLLNALFAAGGCPGTAGGGGAGDCAEAADANNDGAIDCSDPLWILDWLFLGGWSPAPPGPDCGTDPDASGSPGDLGCNAYPACS